MSLTELFSKWASEKTLVRILTAEKGKGHGKYVGNIILVDENSANILFYDLDQKKNYNFSMNEIEDVQPFLHSKHGDIQAVNHVKPQQAKRPVINIKEQAIELLRKLPDDEIHTLIPIMRLLISKNTK